MPSSLESFGLPEMLRCGRGIRSSAAGAQSMEEALNRICRYLYDELQTASNERASVLVRCYKTHRFGKLQPSQKAFARKLIGGAEPVPNMRCLTLLASVGEDPRWNDIKRSRGHRAIPLPQKEIVEKAPMIAQLIKQFGLDWNDVIDPQPELLRDREGKSYGVFHVEDAAGSPYIPAQDEFVLRYKIRSVVGCGGLVRSGELFALILFSRVAIDQDAAERFRALALDVKSVLFPFDDDQVFATAS
jgi:hypothetical protein